MQIDHQKIKSINLKYQQNEKQNIPDNNSDLDLQR